MFVLQIFLVKRAHKLNFLLFKPCIKKVKEVAQWVTHHIWATQSEAVCVWWWITQWGFVCVDVSLLTTSFTFFSRGLKSREPNLRALEVHVAFSFFSMSLCVWWSESVDYLLNTSFWSKMIQRNAGCGPSYGLKRYKFRDALSVASRVFDYVL